MPVINDIRLHHADRLVVADFGVADPLERRLTMPRSVA